MNSNAPCPTCPPTWKKVLAFFVDFLGSFFVFGFGIAYFGGGLTHDGFKLEGGPALLVFLLIIAYFVIMGKYFGGTLGKKLVGIACTRR